jgi:hypothetical protein
MTASATRQRRGVSRMNIKSHNRSKGEGKMTELKGQTAAKKSTKKPARPKLSLVSKLAEVQASISNIAKDGYNDFQKYKYVMEANIVKACRMELARRHVMVFPAIQQVKREGSLTTIFTEYTIIDGESDERLRFIWAGTGADKGDKGLYKAITGSQKYFLMKLFQMPTGDDAEAESPVIDDSDTAFEKAYSDWLEMLNTLAEQPSSSVKTLTDAIKIPDETHGNKFRLRLKRETHNWDALKGVVEGRANA